MKQLSFDLQKNISAKQYRAAKKVFNVLQDAGYQAWLVGGSVRDLLLDRPIKDIDFTTNAHPKVVMQLFERVIPVGIEFGTIIVLIENISIEVTTYRLDAEYHDGRRPSKVRFSDSLEEDVMRRDFTINGLAYSLEEKLVYDYVGGIDDLTKKVIRTIGHPNDRFAEDGLRVIRGCRFAATLNFTIDKTTAKAMREHHETLAKVAIERIVDECNKTIAIKRKNLYWQYLLEADVITLFLPELSDKNCWQETLVYFKNADTKDTSAYFALLFYSFYHKKNIEKTALHQRIKALKLSKNNERLIYSLLDSALFKLYKESAASDWSYNFKIFLSGITMLEFFHHLRFVRIIQQKNKANPFDNQVLASIIALVRHIKREKQAIYLSDLAINGDKIIELGLKGKQVGEALKQVHHRVLANELANKQTEILQYISDKFLDSRE